MSFQRGNAAKKVADVSPGPWKSWRKMSRHARAIKFIQTYCASPKGDGHGEPLRLAKFQKEWLEDSLADGVAYSVLQTPRGNGKSSLGGALAVWAAFDDDDTGAPQVPIIATTIGQAIRSCYGVATAMVETEPELLQRALIFTGFASPRVSVPFNRGVLFPMSNDPDGLQGLDYSLAIVDEIGFQPMASWDSLRLASGKRSRSLVAGLGTPGFDHDNALWDLRQRIHEGADLPGFVFREFAAPDGCALDDRKAWRIANPALGSTDRSAGFLHISALEVDLGLAGPGGGVGEGHFRIFRLGQWVDGVESWLGSNGSAIWEGLTNPYDLVSGERTWIGVDIAIERDTSAVVTMQRREDGRYHAVSRVWRPVKDRPVDVTDVMQYLRDLADRYRVEGISFDPRFFDVPAKMLSDEGLPLIKVPQSVEHMTMAYGSLYEAILGGQITHDGDPVLATHVLNGVHRFNPRGFILEKGKSSGKIDAAVALALAYDQALRHEQEQPSVYESGRGLVAI